MSLFSIHYKERMELLPMKSTWIRVASATKIIDELEKDQIAVEILLAKS